MGEITFEMHFHLASAPRARTHDTKRLPGYGGACLKANSLPPTSDIYIHALFLLPMEVLIAVAHETARLLLCGLGTTPWQSSTHRSTPGTIKKGAYQDEKFAFLARSMPHTEPKPTDVDQGPSDACPDGQLTSSRKDHDDAQQGERQMPSSSNLATSICTNVIDSRNTTHTNRHRPKRMHTNIRTYTQADAHTRVHTYTHMPTDKQAHIRPHTTARAHPTSTARQRQTVNLVSPGDTRRAHT
jgi:hypothetical protein